MLRFVGEFKKNGQRSVPNLCHVLYRQTGCDITGFTGHPKTLRPLRGIQKHCGLYGASKNIAAFTGHPKTLPQCHFSDKTPFL